MHRNPSLALTIAVAIGSIVLGAQAAFAASADGATAARHIAPSGKVMTLERAVNWWPKPRPTATATTAPSPSATTTSVPALPKPTAICAYPTTSFNGGAYCPLTIAGVRSTAYGTGVRVVLKGVTVTAANGSSVTVAAWALPPCTPGNFCGATLTLQSLVVPWSGTNTPTYGDVLDLFGVTIPASITPDGYITTGNCPIDYC